MFAQYACIPYSNLLVHVTGFINCTSYHIWAKMTANYDQHLHELIIMQVSKEESLMHANISLALFLTLSQLLSVMPKCVSVAILHHTIELLFYFLHLISKSIFSQLQLLIITSQETQFLSLKLNENSAIIEFTLFWITSYKREHCYVHKQ